MDVFDIIIVGSGIVGLTAAVALAQQGFQVGLVGAAAFPSMPQPNDAFEPKVVALTRASQGLFEQLKIWPCLPIERLGAYTHMVIWDDSMDGLIRFSASDYFENDLGHIVEQRVLLAALWAAAQQQPNLEIIAHRGLEQLCFFAEHVDLYLAQQLRLRAKVVIGADGANSLLRNLAKFSTQVSPYHHFALTAVVKGSIPHDATAYQRFAAQGILALLPLATANLATVVWSCTEIEARRLQQLSPHDFAVELQRESNAVLGELALESERFIFPLSSHHVKDYVKARCALVGDAAHTLHPLAGQGVNLGLLDVAALVDVLAAAQTKQLDIGALTLLKKYQRQRRWHNQLAIWAMQLFKQGFATTWPSLQRLRNLGMKWLNRQQALKQILVTIALAKP